MSENELAEALAESLRQLPGVESVKLRRAEHGPDRGWDAGLDLVVRRQRTRLVVDCKRQVFPRDVAPRLASRQESLQGEIPMLAAAALSPGARELLQQEGVNYWDAASGSLFLQLPQALYLVDRPAPSAPRRVRQALFRGVSSLVVHCLLLEPQRAWKVQELAHEAMVSLATVSDVFTALEERGYVERTGRGPQTVRQLVEPGALLDEWAQQHTLRDYETQRYYALASTPAALENLLEKTLSRSQAEYALTLEAGALRMAPLRTGPLERWSVLTSAPDELAAVLTPAGFRRVDEGENLQLLVTTSAHTTPTALHAREELAGLWVASPVQLYLDLIASPRRGKEQARHVRAERLGY